MADLSHYDRMVAAREAYPNYSAADQARQKSIPIIERVLRETAGKREIEVLLALGAACPFGLLSDQLVWLEECKRLRGVECP